jgi:hypothetical protein
MDSAVQSLLHGSIQSITFAIIDGQSITFFQNFVLYHYMETYCVGVEYNNQLHSKRSISLKADHELIQLVHYNIQLQTAIILEFQQQPGYS